MKAEQMELMKVIEFPKQKIEEKETNERMDKIEMAYEMLKYLAKYKTDFHIIIPVKQANELFKITKEEMKKYKYIVLTSDYEKGKNISIDDSAFYRIKGDEF